jgi:uncharacterized membrane protein YfcA
VWVILFVSVAGFVAQLIDGSMGMGFGVSATSLLLLLAYSPAAASAVVHFAEIGTTAFSGVSHIKLGNVDWPTITKIAVPGGLAAFVGAMVLSTIDLAAARPWTSGVLLVLGVIIILRFLRVRVAQTVRPGRKRWLVPLGVVGGFVDSTGGGGWGPVVTTSLTVSGVLEPRKAIGTANAAEFVVAVSASTGFLLGLGANAIPWSAVLALMIGGLFAAPIAAWVITVIPQRILGSIVGFFIVFLNTYQLSLAFLLPVLARWFALGVVALAGVLIIALTGRRSAAPD